MDTRRSQTGAALIMLIGIVAVLAILSATLVVTIANQQGATARERRATQSFYAAEAALDTGVQLAKVDRKMSTTEEWLTQEDLQAAFYGFFPVDATVVYRVYDNLSQVDYNIKWDQGGPTDAHTPDGRMWVEATVTHQGKTTRTRALIWQGEVPLAEALPKAVTYSDTGIRLDDNSDIYAVNEDNTPDTSGPPYQTSITAGGTWVPTMDSGWAEVGRFTMNGSTDLAAPGTNVQSLGITVNGSVSMAGSLRNGPLDAGTISDGVRSFDSVTIRPFTVGFLSDYFDQKAQTELANESQIGGTPAAMPAAPPSWTYSGRSITGSLLTTITGGSYSNTTEDLYLLSSVNRGDNDRHVICSHLPVSQPVHRQEPLHQRTSHVHGRLPLCGRDADHRRTYQGLHRRQQHHQWAAVHQRDGQQRGHGSGTALRLVRILPRPSRHLEQPVDERHRLAGPDLLCRQLQRVRSRGS